MIVVNCPLPSLAKHVFRGHGRSAPITSKPGLSNSQLIRVRGYDALLYCICTRNDILHWLWPRAHQIAHHGSHYDLERLAPSPRCISLLIVILGRELRTGVAAQAAGLWKHLGERSSLWTYMAKSRPRAIGNFQFSPEDATKMERHFCELQDTNSNTPGRRRIDGHVTITICVHLHRMGK